MTAHWIKLADTVNRRIQRLRYVGAPVNHRAPQPAPPVGALNPEIGPRDALIENNMKVVGTIVGKLLAARQNTAIERDDLLQVGYIEMIRTIDRPVVGNLPLDKRIARNVSTVIFRYIAEQLREGRYSQRGNQKAIRDTAAGHQAGDVDGGFDEMGRSDWQDGNTAPAVIPLSVKNRDFPNTDEFVYRGWLRGTVSVVGERFIIRDSDGQPRVHVVYGFKSVWPSAFEPLLSKSKHRPEYLCARWKANLAPREFYAGSLFQNIRREWPTTLLQHVDPHPAYPWEASFRKDYRWKIPKGAQVREVRLHPPRGREARMVETVRKWGATIGPVRAGCA